MWEWAYICSSSIPIGMLSVRGRFINSDYVKRAQLISNLMILNKYLKITDRLSYNCDISTIHTSLDILTSLEGSILSLETDSG